MPKPILDSRDVTPKSALKLLEPRNGSVTGPLQLFDWPRDERGKRDVPSDKIPWQDLKKEGVDLSFPAAVTFAWKAATPVPGEIHYTLSVARDTDFKDAIHIRNLVQPRADVRHLFIATRYYWRVTAFRRKTRIAVSPVWRFRTHERPPRWIRVPGMTNVRDIGGWPLPHGRRIRQGLIYRTSEMNSHMAITEEGKELLTKTLGIRTDLDLRSSPEEIGAVLDPARVKWIHAPIGPYQHIRSDKSKSSFRRIFSLFADRSRYPIMFHCWGGADRGGSLAFLLNALLGKSMKHLEQDYELTSLAIWGERSRHSMEFQQLLETLRSFGNGSTRVVHWVESFLQWVGTTPDEIRRIRKNLIE